MGNEDWERIGAEPWDCEWAWYPRRSGHIIPFADNPYKEMVSGAGPGDIFNKTACSSCRHLDMTCICMNTDSQYEGKTMAGPQKCNCWEGR